MLSEQIHQLHAHSRGGRGVCVAVIDGPVDPKHPFFSGTTVRFVEEDGHEQSRHGVAAAHGTYIAGIIFSKEGAAVTGIAPGCSGLLLPVLADGPAGMVRPCSQLQLAQAILRAAESGADIINISAGQFVQSGGSWDLLQRALRFCEDRGILVVAAAGNDGCDCAHVPAADATVLAVGAHDAAGDPAPWSNWGADYKGHAILAPGTDIEGASPSGDLVRSSGTSPAAAVVSGVAAVLLSILRERTGEGNGVAIRQLLLATAEPCDPRKTSPARCLAGRLNISRALAALPGPVTTDLDTATENNQMSETILHASAEQIPAETAGIMPSSCGCGCSGKPAKVYALGQISFDYGTEARRDSFLQAGISNPHDPVALADFLGTRPEFSEAVTWVLTQETTAIYAVRPEGAYASLAYDRLREFMASQIREGVERVSIPGIIRGNIALLNGQTVPVIVPQLRGMYSWTTTKLVQSLVGMAPETPEQREQFDSRVRDLSNFLERVYYEIRNLGMTSEERALNYAATNAFQAEFVFRDAMERSLKLDNIHVSRSPVCRPESDCWDVELTFFNPMRRLEQARTVHRFTVDVSDVIPVTVGKIRQWEIY